jgi:lactoylglutathione lyase
VALSKWQPDSMPMTLRFEIFPADLDLTVDFYTRVLGFRLVRDQRADTQAYVAMARDEVRVGAAARREGGDRSHRRPPTGVELVLEVDDVVGEHDRVRDSGWPLEEDLQQRPWGLQDFRLIDPSGYYLRFTSRVS